MKFLVIWKLELSLLSPHVAAAVARMPGYAQPLEKSGQVAARYHIVGAHGGAWVYDVGSNEELERLIAMMPIYNFAHYTVYPLADMPDWPETPVPAPDPGPASSPGSVPASGEPGRGPLPLRPASHPAWPLVLLRSGSIWWPVILRSPSRTNLRIRRGCRVHVV